jgi:chemotaxis protein MotB
MADLDNNSSPIFIIRKKKSGHGGHHGGAWKVAYADFVTALMALFIVLWIVNSSQEVRDAVSGYFKDPRGFGKDSGTAKPGTGKSPAVTVEVARATMDDLKKKLEEAMKKMPELEKLKDQVEITVTNEGLRIELLETEKGMFFESGSTNPTAFGKELIELLAKEIGRLPNHVLIEGHTDSRKYVSAAGYSNWELSADRANSARRIMQTKAGLRDDQVSEVRGYAFQKLRKPKQPEDASNRRISVTVQYLDGSTPGEHVTTTAGTLDVKTKPAPAVSTATKQH